MLALPVLLLASLLFDTSTARMRRVSDHLRHRRQGTLVQSDDPTDFGKCTVPEIIGAVGLDNRVEFAFEPADKANYPHGSAQNIGIITDFICDTLINTCGASTAAHDLCDATAAAIGAGKNDGALADRFNAAFGLVTDNASAAGSTPAAGAVSSASVAASTVARTATTTTTSAATTIAATTSAAATSAAAVPTVTVTVTVDCAATSGAAVATTTTAKEALATPAPSAGSTALDLGSCDDPTILFKNGLDGRNQPAFIAQNQGDFPHGSALAINVIAAFIMDRFNSPCGASAEAMSAAQAGLAAAQAVGAGKGAAADAWNEAFGITTNFAAGAVRA